MSGYLQLHNETFTVKRRNKIDLHVETTLVTDYSHIAHVRRNSHRKKSDAISSKRLFIRESRTLSNNFDLRCLTSPTVLSATTRGAMIMDHYPSVHEFKQKIFLLVIRSTSLLSVEKPFTNCYKIGSLFGWNFYEKNLVVCLRRNTYTC